MSNPAERFNGVNDAAVRQLRTAVGAGNSVVYGDLTYSVARARANFGDSGEAKTVQVLIATDAKGHSVALEMPRSQGRRARRLMMTAGNPPQRVQLPGDPAAQVRALTDANRLLAQVEADLRAQFDRSLSVLGAPNTLAHIGGSLAIKTGDPNANIAERVIDLRSHLIPNAEAKVRSIATKLAEQVMTTMALDPNSVQRFADRGYIVVDEQHDFVDKSWEVHRQTTARLCFNGTPVHPLPSSAPADLSLQPTTPMTDIAAACAFIRDITGERSALLHQSQPRAEDAAVIELIKRAIGESNSVAIGDVTYGVRTVEVVDRARRDSVAEVLFRTSPRDAAIPASLAVPTAVEWPDDAAALISTLDADDPAVALYGAAVAPANAEQRHCVDRTYSSAARDQTVREAAAIVRAVLDSELNAYAAARELLARSPSDSGAEAAATLARRIPAVDASTATGAVVAAIDLIRDELMADAEDAAAIEGPRVVNSLRKLMIASSEVYTQASKRGYRLETLEVPYQVRSGIKLGDFLCLTLDGAPLQVPPPNHRDIPNAPLALRAAWPKIERATARRILRDAGDFRAIAESNRAPSRDGLA